MFFISIFKISVFKIFYTVLIHDTVQEGYREIGTHILRECKLVRYKWKAIY